MKKSKDPKETGRKASAGPASEEIVGEMALINEPEGPADIEPKAEAPTKPVSDDDALVAEPLQQDNHHDPGDVAEEHGASEEHGEPGHRSLAATALMILVGIIVIASLTLWAAPKLAPHLPAGIARYLAPGQIDTESRLASLDKALTAGVAKSDAAISSLKAEIAALYGRLDAAANSGQTDAAIAAAQSAAQSATDAAAALATRLDALEAELMSLRDEFGAVSSVLADARTGDSPASPELAAAVAALDARLDNLATSVAAGDAALATRLDALEISAAAARDVQTEALGKASSAIRQARMQAAIDLLTSRLNSGLPYSEKLNQLAELTGAAPPSALSAAAETGLTTAAALEASFGRHAQAAIAADVQASAGDDTGLKALGWLRAQIAGRPITEQPGDSVGAITSRIAARVKDGNLVEALSEVEMLPAHAQVGLGSWLDQLRARVAADTALADWRAQIEAGG